MEAILLLLLTNLPAIIKGGTAVVELIGTIRTAALQSDVWTPEHEAAYQAQLSAATTAPEWQPDKP
jgi:hypothetical protein